MLVHTGLTRVAQIAKVWADAGCSVVIHVDAKVPSVDYDWLTSEMGEHASVSFCARHRCEWGRWGLVAATQTAAQHLFQTSSDLGHVLLTSGSCLPLRPPSDLMRYLEQFPTTDFIESVTTQDAAWAKGGLEAERFSLYFPISWKKNRTVFDWLVKFQRAVGVSRKIPDDITPHMGSQWWCLTAQTLRKILDDPKRATYDRYFKDVWIPDESYFQTLVRKHTKQIESRSLTLAKFDYQGKPYNFYDDHLPLLKRSDCFLARKIWPGADALYDYFLGPENTAENRLPPAPSKIDRVFAHSLERRTNGRPGLVMQSRFPQDGVEKTLTARPYVVFQGLHHVAKGFDTWLGQHTDLAVHGRLFHPHGAEFAGGQDGFTGALTSDAAIRDRNVEAFLRNLIWNARTDQHCFQFGPDDNQAIVSFLSRDANATVINISGAWAIPLARADLDFRQKRKIAAHLQKREVLMLDTLRQRQSKAQLVHWALADFMQSPDDAFQSIVSRLPIKTDLQTIAPPAWQSLDGFYEFVQMMKNDGLHLSILGDFPATSNGVTSPLTQEK